MPSALLGKLNLVSQLVERGSPDSDVWNLRCLRRRGCQVLLKRSYIRHDTSQAKISSGLLGFSTGKRGTDNSS